MHPDQYRPVIFAPQPTSGLAVTSGIMGIVGLLGGCLLLGLPCFAAIVLGHLATRETRNGARGGHGWAITGLVTGYMVIGPVVVFGAIYLVMGVLGVATGSLDW